MNMTCSILSVCGRVRAAADIAGLFFDKPYNQVVLIPNFNIIDFNLLIYLESDFVLNDLNLIRKGSIENACEVYENYSANSLLFDTYIID